MSKTVNFKLFVLLALVALAGLGVDGHKTWRDAKCECEAGDPFDTRVRWEPYKVRVRPGQITFTNVDCGLVKEQAVPIEARWTFHIQGPFVLSGAPGAPTSTARIGISLSEIPDVRGKYVVTAYANPTEALYAGETFSHLEAFVEHALKVDTFKNRFNIDLPPNTHLTYLLFPPGTDEFVAVDLSETDGQAHAEATRIADIPQHFLENIKTVGQSKKCYYEAYLAFYEVGKTKPAAVKVLVFEVPCLQPV